MADTVGIAAAQLKSIVERIERLEEEKKALAKAFSPEIGNAGAEGLPTWTRKLPSGVALRPRSSHSATLVGSSNPLWMYGGFGGEISSLIMEEAFQWLDSPVRRVGSTFTPVGFNRILEKAILPDTKRIYDAALDLLKY